MDTTTPVTYELGRDFWGDARKLVFAPEYLEYNTHRIAAAEITDIRHRMRWIVWYRFHVGRVYEVVIRYKGDAELKIVFKSYFGLRNRYMDLYGNMIETFWAMYFQNVVDGYLARFNSGNDLTVSGVRLTEAGVRFSADGDVVPWEKVGYAEYYSYFGVYHVDDAKLNVRRDFYAWESEILLSLIRTIKAERAADI